ncbi:MAG: DUF3857 domain-containing protein [Saprospiraceae bacterium]
MTKLSYLLLLFCFYIANLSAQETEMTYGEIPAEELAMETYYPDSTAAAVVLGNIGKIEFSPFIFGSYTLSHYCRIKVFDPSAFDLKDVAIRALKPDNSDWRNSQSAVVVTGRVDADRFTEMDIFDLQNLQAAVVAPDGTRIELSEADMFEEKVFGKVYTQMFALPNLQPGSVIEYSYRLNATNLATLQNWYFQTSIPTRYSELEIKLPNWLEYAMIMQGDMEPTQKTEERVQYNYSGYGYPESKQRYIYTDVPALKSDSYITTMDDYPAGIEFHLLRVKLPRRIVVEYMGKWDDLVNKLLKQGDRFAKLYQKKNSYRLLSAAITPLLTNAKTEREKAQIIYDYVNQNMEWDNNYNVFGSDVTLNKIYKRRKGNSADLNLMVAAILQQEQISFTPILLSTRQHGKMYPLHPTIAQFNHVILQVELDGETVLIDATGDEFLPLGMLRMESLSKIGWRVKLKEYTWVALNPATAADIFIADFNLMENGILNGKVQSIQSGYNAVKKRRSQADSLMETLVQKRLAKQFPDVKMDETTYKNLAAIDKELYSEFTCEIPVATQSMGDVMYFSPVVYSDFFENPFKLEQRSYPIDVPYPIQEQSVITINLPEGYQLEELPEKVLLTLPEGAGKFQYMVTQENNSIKLVSKIKLDQLYFLPEEYPRVKGFFDLIAAKLKEQIVLKKITASNN